MSGFDELRFGAERTLNLRESLPDAAEAVRRAEAWLRQQQVQGSKEVLVITGRGSHSVGGTAVIRPAIEKLLASLRRRGVVASYQEHNPGALSVQLAALRALVDAPPRRRERAAPRPTAELHGLDKETVGLLRDLAELSLDALGVAPDESRITDEMHRQLGVLLPGLPAGAGMENQLRVALRAAIAEYD